MGVTSAAAAAAIAVLALGVAAAVTVSPAHAGTGLATTTSTTSKTVPPKAVTSTSLATPPTPTTTAPIGPVSPTLTAALIVPIDQGGFYTIRPPLGAADFAGSACLATLAHQPGQTGTALTYLEGPNAGGLPGIAEFVASYQAGEAAAAYRAAAADLGACRHLSTTLAGGARLSTVLSPLPINSIGTADVAEKGAFSLDGRAQTITIAVVERGPVVLTMIYLDSVPPANALYDNFSSTLTTAFGKLA